MTLARYNQAILTFDRAIALKPKDFGEAWVMRGLAHSALYENEAAINDFTKAAQLRPHDPAAFLERGQAYLSEKDYLAAMADGSCVVAIDPNLAAAYNLRGMAVRETGDPRKALEDFIRAVRLAPNADNYFQRRDLPTPWRERACHRRLHAGHRFPAELGWRGSWMGAGLAHS